MIVINSLFVVKSNREKYSRGETELSPHVMGQRSREALSVPQQKRHPIGCKKLKKREVFALCAKIRTPSPGMQASRSRAAKPNSRPTLWGRVLVKLSLRHNKKGTRLGALIVWRRERDYNAPQNMVKNDTKNTIYCVKFAEWVQIRNGGALWQLRFRQRKGNLGSLFGRPGACESRC